MIPTTIINSTSVKPPLDDFMILTPVEVYWVAHVFPCAIQTKSGKRHARPMVMFPSAPTYHTNVNGYMELTTILGITGWASGLYIRLRQTTCDRIHVDDMTKSA